MRDAAGVGEQYVALPDLIGRGRLEDALERRGILGKEIPCMAFKSTGAPISKLLTAEEWLFIIVTSPESASILVRAWHDACLLYTSPSPRDVEESRMPSSA